MQFTVTPTTELWGRVAATIADSQDFWTDFDTFDSAVSYAAQVFLTLGFDVAVLDRPSFPPPK